MQFSGTRIAGDLPVACGISAKHRCRRRRDRAKKEGSPERWDRDSPCALTGCLDKPASGLKVAGIWEFFGERLQRPCGGFEVKPMRPPMGRGPTGRVVSCPLSKKLRALRACARPQGSPVGCWDWLRRSPGTAHLPIAAPPGRRGREVQRRSSGKRLNLNHLASPIEITTTVRILQWTTSFPSVRSVNHASCGNARSLAAPSFQEGFGW